jgi:hypothetical protein
MDFGTRAPKTFRSTHRRMRRIRMSRRETLLLWLFLAWLALLVGIMLPYLAHYMPHTEWHSHSAVNP